MPRLPSYLDQEIATVRSNPIVPVYGGSRLHPQDETLISRGGGGYLAYDIYTDLAKDDHTYSVLQKRYMAVIGREWEVKAASESAIDKKAADMVKAQLEALATRTPFEENGEAIITTGGGFDHACWGMLSAILYGFAPAEIMWGQDGKEIYASELLNKDLRRFAFKLGDRGYKLRLLTLDNSFDGIAVPPRKFIVHRFASLPTEDPYGLGMGTRLFYPVYFKRNTVKFWLVFADKWASPTAVGKYPRNASKEQKQRLLEMLGAIATDAGIIIPDDMVVEFLEAQRSGTVSTYQDLVNFCDGEISKAVLGETGTTDQRGSGGSRARDQVGNEVRIEVAKADADLLSETLNRTLIPWIVQLNLPDAKPPKVWRKFPELEEKFDRQGEAGIVQILVNAGFVPTRKWVAEKFEIELEEEQQQEQPSSPDAAPDLGGLFGQGAEIAQPEKSAPSEKSATDPPLPELSESVDFGSIIDRVIQWQGLSIGVEYLPGQVRFPGRKNSKKLKSGYGHIRNYKGADGEALDCYLFTGFFRDIDDDEPSDKVFEVTQLTQDGEFDEHKFMLGYGTLAEAKAAYLREMPEFLFGGIREVAIADLEQYRKADFAEASDELDIVDHYTQQSLKSVDSILNSWVDRFKQFLDGSADLEEARDKLFDLYSDLPANQFAEVMGSAIAAAELAGRYEVIQEGEEDADFAEALSLLQRLDTLEFSEGSEATHTEAIALLRHLDSLL